MAEPVRGIGYDAGVLYEKGFESNPFFTEQRARRDFRAIREELGFDAVLIMASDPDRLAIAATIAVEEGLGMWLQPRPFDRPRHELVDAVRSAADTAERLRASGAKVGLVVGCELTLSTPGMLPGPTFWARGALLTVTFPLLPLANLRLRRLLAELVGEARERFAGPVSYGSGEWERPDWSIFDVVGADRYRDARNAWRFEDDIRALADRAHAQNKPCYVFEFGSCTYRGAAAKASTAAGVLHGRTELSVPKNLVRDEQEQADYLTDLLDVFDRAGVDGTFVWGFSEPALTTSDEPARDLDLASYGIVAAHADGTWRPKRAYHALAHRYLPTMTTTPRPRSLRLVSAAWRIALAILPLGAGLALATILLPAWDNPSDPATLSVRIAVGIAISTATLTVIALLVRRADRRRMSDAGLTNVRTGWRLAVWGAIGWTVPAAATFGVLALLGTPLTVTVAGPELARTVLLLFVAVLLAEALPEEAVFRGYVTTVLGTLTRGWGVIVIQALLFTLFATLNERGRE